MTKLACIVILAVYALVSQPLKAGSLPDSLHVLNIKAYPAGWPMGSFIFGAEYQITRVLGFQVLSGTYRNAFWFSPYAKTNWELLPWNHSAKGFTFIGGPRFYLNANRVARIWIDFQVVYRKMDFHEILVFQDLYDEFSATKMVKPLRRSLGCRALFGVSLAYKSPFCLEAFGGLGLHGTRTDERQDFDITQGSGVPQYLVDFLQRREPYRSLDFSFHLGVAVGFNLQAILKPGPQENSGTW